MTPKKLRDLRYRMGRALRDCFPGMDMVDIGQAVRRLEPIVVAAAFDLVNLEHPRDCACWHCILEHNGEVLRSMAEWKVKQELAEDRD